MAKFDAGTAVESLDWDFTAFGGDKGVIIEPSTAKVNTFFNRMKELMREVTSLQDKYKDLDSNNEDLDDADLEAKIGQVDEATASASEYQSKSIEYLAELCGATRDPETGAVTGGSPSVEQLQTLPYRVLTAFTQWLIGEIRPKSTAPAGKR